MYSGNDPCVRLFLQIKFNVISYGKRIGTFNAFGPEFTPDPALVLFVRLCSDPIPAPR